MKKYRIHLTEKLILKTRVEIEVPESTWELFMDDEGVINDCLEAAESTCEFAVLLDNNDIKVIRYTADYEAVEVEEVEYDSFDELED